MKPGKNATHEELWEYALKLYRGNRHKAESYIKGWNNAKRKGAKS